MPVNKVWHITDQQSLHKAKLTIKYFLHLKIANVGGKLMYDTKTSVIYVLTVYMTVSFMKYLYAVY